MLIMINDVSLGSYIDYCTGKERSCRIELMLFY